MRRIGIYLRASTEERVCIQDGSLISQKQRHLLKVKIGIYAPVVTSSTNVLNGGGWPTLVEHPVIVKRSCTVQWKRKIFN